MFIYKPLNERFEWIEGCETKFIMNLTCFDLICLLYSPGRFGDGMYWDSLMFA